MAIVETLESMPGKPGVKGKLIDAEGFPRADVDIHTVRIHRNRLAHLQTDHQAAMKQIEQALFAHHSKIKSDPSKSQVLGVRVLYSSEHDTQSGLVRMRC